MFILVVEPGKEPETREISGDLGAMQEIVGGMIQAIYPFPGEEIALVCNEEGMLLGLPPNRGLWDESGALYDIVCGTFFLCGAPADSETFASLTDEQIKRLEHRFHTPEMFVGMGGRIVCLPME
ncbi:MAG: DUF3846 domain-containing protein [Butyricicoccus sp.]|nr:DUF3846 domain-containing protein [Butyricicoccus sp.]